MAIIILCVLAGATLLGLIVGLCKGYLKTKTWATEWLAAACIVIVAKKLIPIEGTWFNIAFCYGLAVVLLIVFALLSKYCKRTLRKSIEAKSKFSYYAKLEESQEHDLDLADCARQNQRRQFRKLSKKKIKISSGFGGVFNRLMGGATLAIKGFGFSFALIGFALFFIQLMPFGFVSHFDAVLQSGVWQFLGKYIPDFLIVGVLYLVLRTGYNAGISSPLCGLLVFALLAGTAYLSFALSFQFYPELGANVGGWLVSKIEFFGNLPYEIIGKVIMIVVFFLPMLVLVILFGIYFPRVVEKAREGKAFLIIDGIIGALVALAIVAVIGFALFGMLGTIADLPVMQKFTESVKGSVFIQWIYTENPLKQIFEKIPLRAILTNT